MADILAVVNFGGPHTEEQAAIDLLTGDGHTVSTQEGGSATDPWPYDPGDFDAVVFLPDASILDWPGVQALTEGVVVSGASNLLMAVETSNGSNQTSVTVVDETHPIAVAAGLTNGSVTVYSEAGRTQRIVEAADGIHPIADYAVVPGAPVISVCEQGADLTTGPAPGRRVHLSILDGPELWTPDAEALFLASVNWAAGESSPTTTVSIDQSDPQQVEVGSTLQLSATVTNGDGATTWASDAEAVATVDASGLVTGVAAGAAEITATNNGVSDSITVNVTAVMPETPGLTATATSWDAVHLDITVGSDTDEVNVYRAAIPEVTDADTLVATVTESGDAFDTGLSADTDYYYLPVASNANGDTEGSEVSTATFGDDAVQTFASGDPISFPLQVAEGQRLLSVRVRLGKIVRGLGGLGRTVGFTITARNESDVIIGSETFDDVPTADDGEAYTVTLSPPIEGPHTVSVTVTPSIAE